MAGNRDRVGRRPYERRRPLESTRCSPNPQRQHLQRRRRTMAQENYLTQPRNQTQLLRRQVGMGKYAA